MATVIGAGSRVRAGDEGFFVGLAAAMAAVLAAGFTLHLAMGRSSFSAPMLTHAHGVIFFGWVVLFLTQTILAAQNARPLHRMLGWLSVGWMIVMVVLGCAIVVMKVRAGQAPFFFLPQHFLIANPMTVLTFAGLTVAALANRRRTDWHRRLHIGAMAMIMGPGFGRLLPMPLMMPVGFQVAELLGLVFPLVGMVRDYRVRGRVHPAWWWCVGTLVATMLLSEAIVYSPLGDAIYALVTAGSPGASVAPLDFAPMPARP